MKQIVNQLLAQIEEFKVNSVAQLEKGNKAAGARARKNALAIMKLMKDFRKASVDAAK